MSIHTDTTIECDSCPDEIIALESEAHDIPAFLKLNDWAEIDGKHLCAKCLAAKKED